LQEESHYCFFGLSAYPYLFSLSYFFCAAARDVLITARKSPEEMAAGWGLARAVASGVCN